MAEEKLSLMQGGRNGRTDYYSSNSLHWNQITFKALDKNNSSSLGTCPQALICDHLSIIVEHVPVFSIKQITLQKLQENYSNI